MKFIRSFLTFYLRYRVVEGLYQAGSNWNA